MNRPLLFWLGVLVVNVALACAVATVAPRDIGTTADRLGYQYVEQHELAPDCPHSIFCYRVLVPTVLTQFEAPDVVRWRAFVVGSNGVTGTLLAVLGVAAVRIRPWTTAVVASIAYQMSFGAAFAVFDPFTPDAAVYAIAALLAILWWLDRPWLALCVALIGVFAKEAVSLVISAAALAAYFLPRSRRGPWLIAALVTWLAILGFHAVMDTRFGWTEQGSASADVLGGAWLGRWLADPTLTTSSRLLYLFIPFGFAWLYAALGLGEAPRRLRTLALSSLVCLPVLVYVQTPERALATLGYVVIPLAAVYLGRQPLVLALAAVLTNGLLTLRVGLSTTWLPPIPYLLILAGSVAAVTIVSGALRSRGSSSVLLASSRTTSTR
jgi:hypothetical protein